MNGQQARRRRQRASSDTRSMEEPGTWGPEGSRFQQGYGQTCGLRCPSGTASPFRSSTAFPQRGDGEECHQCVRLHRSFPSSSFMAVSHSDQLHSLEFRDGPE